MGRDDFSEETKRIIAGRVGYRCCFPGCAQETIGPNTEMEKRTSLGEAAHITAAAPGGARYDSSITSEQRKSAENGIWMCRIHAKLIDADATKYPVELLRKWKADAEYEQSCKVSGYNYNINGATCDTSSRRNEALRLLYSSINNINQLDLYSYSYYKANFERFGDTLLNELLNHSEIYMEKLKEIANEENRANQELIRVMNEYGLDIPSDITKKLTDFLQLKNFAYSCDEIGVYNDYWEKYFYNLRDNYKKRQTLSNEVKQDIHNAYTA